MIGRFARLAWAVPNRLFLSEAREAIVDLRGLPLNVQVLTVAGYLGMFFLLGLTLILEFIGQNFTPVAFTMTAGTVDTGLRVPLLVMAVSSLAFVLGWAFLMTGATDCRRRVFLPAVVLFISQLFFLTPLEGTTLGTLLPCLLGTPAIGLLVVFYFVAPRWKLWQEWPIIEFIIWGVFISAMMAMLWLFNQTNAAVAGSLHAAFTVLLLLSVGFWVISGLLVTDMAVSLARWFVSSLDGVLPGSVLRAMVVALCLVRPAVALTIALSIKTPDHPVSWGFLIDSFLSIPLLLSIPVLWVLRRWDTAMAARVLALAIATPVFSLGVAMALKGQDISDLTGLVLEGVNLFPPTLVFVALNAYGALTYGSTFANSDGRIMPRTGRLFVYLGLVFLLIAFTLFFANVDNATTGQPETGINAIIDGAFGISAMLLGVPYLLWIFWRRPERLIGQGGFMEDKAVILAGLGRVPERAWLAVGLAAALFFCCVSCGLLTFMFQ